jgi:hypothetical protein
MATKKHSESGSKSKAPEGGEDKIRYATLDELFLDAKNPRLGRSAVAKDLSQADVLDVMKEWTLEELATSFCENGFWPQEALIAVREPVTKKQDGLVVVEGNRRLAALKLLQAAALGEPNGTKYKELVEAAPEKRLRALRERIPYMEMPSRAAVKSYLGYRHVTGIKEWRPAEKAEFIASLIDDDKLSYDEVRKRIGSKLPTVRLNYISYRLLLQMEEHSEKVDVEKVEERFSVLYLSLRSEGTRKYLQIDIEADPKTARMPVKPERLAQLEYFARWLFGDAKREPVVADSRQVDEFGQVLLSEGAIQYLERTEKPSFQVAKRMAGVSEAEVATHIETAADEVEEALRAAHHHKSSSRVQAAVRRLAGDCAELTKSFPVVLKELKKELSAE